MSDQLLQPRCSADGMPFISMKLLITLLVYECSLQVIYVCCPQFVKLPLRGCFFSSNFMLRVNVNFSFLLFRRLVLKSGEILLICFGGFFGIMIVSNKSIYAFCVLLLPISASVKRLIRQTFSHVRFRSVLTVILSKGNLASRK